MIRRSDDPVVTEYRKLAGFYDKRWTFYVEATVRETLQRMEFAGGDRILDVACGTGQLLLRLAGAHAAAPLYGIDVSADMLAKARTRVGAAAVVACGRAEELPFEDGVFDVVVSTNSFHFFRQPERALGEMSRVLLPHGRIVITDWCDDFLTCRICDRVLRLATRAHQRVYGSAECRELLEAAGFANAVVDRYKINWLWGMMTARGVKPAPHASAQSDRRPTRVKPPAR